MNKNIHFLVISLVLIITVYNIKCNENLFISDQKNVFYIESEQKFTWYDALAKCARMNMSLITIDSKLKSEDITALLNNLFGKPILLWMGGCINDANPRQFVWISTGKKFIYTNWAAGQPDFAGNQEYCAQIGWKNSMEWNDHVCSHSFGFMCEYSRHHVCAEKLQNILQKDTEKQKADALKKTVGEILHDYKISDGETKTFRDIIFNIHPNSK